MTISRRYQTMPAIAHCRADGCSWLGVTGGARAAETAATEHAQETRHVTVLLISSQVIITPEAALTEELQSEVTHG